MTCRNNTDCSDGKYCMSIHGSTLSVCIDADDAMRLYRDAGKHPTINHSIYVLYFRFSYFKDSSVFNISWFGESSLSIIAANPHMEYPYENLLSRKTKYQHCQKTSDCSAIKSPTHSMTCQNMACLGKICVTNPIAGCLTGFECPEHFNCVHPRCGSELQTGFGICLPLALPELW